MPHRTSLVRRVADLRRLYTGETVTTAHPDMVAAARLLTDADRRLLETEFDCDVFVRLPGIDGTPPLPGHLRAAVLPDATETSQQILEAGILGAVERATVHLDHPAAAVGAWLASGGGRVLRKVRPQLDGLTLHVNAAALAPLLFELLPRLTCDGDLVGVPGLRAVLHRRCVELYVLESPARVTLANLPYRQWAAALAFAEVANPSDPLRWLGNDPTPLRPEESDGLGKPSPEPRSTSLYSALLRRAGLFLTAPRLSLRQVADDEMELAWHGSPALPAMAGRLADPVAGMFNDSVFVAQHGDRLRIAETEAGCAVALDRPRASDADDDGEDDHDVRARWSAWNRTLSRPNATFSSLASAPSGELLASSAIR